MQLELRNVSKKVGRETHLADISLSFDAGTLNILLGPTLSGKTSLMRLMAGLDRPTTGTIHFAGKDVTDVPVQQRNVAMVYQQFINYPNLSVYENIASPLKIAGASAQEIKKTVERVAALLKLEEMLQRSPQELSGGQQQRTALARALAKGAELVLLDEPLANLDYKLREELREELPKIFAETGAIFVYATTEPSEALLLGGNTAALHQGRVTQFGPTMEVYTTPENLITARTLSDPPLNLFPVTKSNGAMRQGDLEVPFYGELEKLADGDYTIAFQPHHLFLAPKNEGNIKIRAEVAVTELTGSESYIHLDIGEMRWVLLAEGIHHFDVGDMVDIYLDPVYFYLFDHKEKLVIKPEFLTKTAQSQQ